MDLVSDNPHQAMDDIASINSIDLSLDTPDNQHSVISEMDEDMETNSSAMQSELLSVHRRCNLFGPFSVEVPAEDIKPRTKMEENRQLLKGKQIFGPFDNINADIEEVPRKQRLDHLIAQYRQLFPRCPDKYLMEVADRTVDFPEQQGQFIAETTRSGGLPPYTYLDSLSPQELDRLGMQCQWSRQFELHQMVSRLHPNISPDYWMQLIQRILQNQPEESLYLEILDTLHYHSAKLKNLPSIQYYHAKKREEELINQYLSVFDPERISPNFNPDFFKRRVVTENYKKAALAFLLRQFNDVPKHVIKSALTAAKDIYYVASKSLESYSGDRRISLRPIEPLPDGIDKDILQEVQYARNEGALEQYRNSRAEVKKQKEHEARILGLMRNCLSCLTDSVPEETMECPAGHRFCWSCIRTASGVDMESGSASLKCRADECENQFSLYHMQRAIAPSLVEIWLRKMQEKEVTAAMGQGTPLSSCPFCGYVALYEYPPEVQKLFTCENPECSKVSCRMCMEPDHLPLRCDQVERKAQLRARQVLEEAMTNSVVRHCNKCNLPFFKLQGCNRMVCEGCKNAQCYLCNKNVKLYEHFYSTLNEKKEGQCILQSDNNKLIIEDARRGALQGKEELRKQNPELQLFHDPSKDVLKDM